MANKVKYGLSNVYYAKITGYASDGTPTYASPVRIPGAVNLSLDPNGEQENFYADNIVYYVINNNSGYTGDLEIAMITESVAVDLLGEQYDTAGNLVESVDAELGEFALMFEFTGDKNKIRHCFFKCTASRSGIEGATTEDSKEVKTDTLSLSVSPLENGLVKKKTATTTSATEYNSWFTSVTIPTIVSNIFSPVSGTTFTDSLTVTLTNPDTDTYTTIKYQINGGEVTNYTSAITLSASSSVSVAGVTKGGSTVTLGTAYYEKKSTSAS